MLFTYFDMLPTGVERHDKLLDSCLDGLVQMHGEGGGRSLSAGVGWRGWERGEAGGVVTREPGTSIPLDSGPSPHCPSRPAASLHWS